MEVRLCGNEGCTKKAKRPGHNFCGPCICAKHRYGLTIPERDTLLSSQGGRCAICKKDVKFDGTAGSREDTANIDHNHQTGKVRSILCWPCNTAIGKFNDDPTLLREAAKYLEKHNGQ
jgi:hypothetical protein